MKIGLISADGHNFPNLALMKIAAFHKKQGDTVEWVNHFERYNKVYVSKVFTFTPDIYTVIQADEIERGGTGYDINKKLPKEIDCQQPDYSIYPLSSWYDCKTAYGFLTRGCIRKCTWCIVPQKEGKITSYMDIEDVLQDKKSAILMDNNILASDFGIQQIEKIIKLKCRVDFNQGLDARIIASDASLAKLLSKVKWLNPLRMACDTISQMEYVEKASKLLRKFNCTPARFFVYTLLTDLNDSYNRINFCKEIYTLPYSQPYRDFTPNQIIPQWQKDMTRWCNDRALLFSIDFKDYNPRKGFYCREYFND